MSYNIHTTLYIVYYIGCYITYIYIILQHTQHGVYPLHMYYMGVAGLGYSIDTGYGNVMQAEGSFSKCRHCLEVLMKSNMLPLSV